MFIESVAEFFGTQIPTPFVSLWNILLIFHFNLKISLLIGSYVYKDGTISKVFVDEREALNAFGRLISVFTQTGKTDALSIYLTVVNVINISNRSDGQVWETSLKEILFVFVQNFRGDGAPKTWKDVIPKQHQHGTDVRKVWFEHEIWIPDEACVMLLSDISSLFLDSLAQYGIYFFVILSRNSANKLFIFILGIIVSLYGLGEPLKGFVLLGVYRMIYLLDKLIDKIIYENGGGRCHVRWWNGPLQKQLYCNQTSRPRSRRVRFVCGVADWYLSK